MSGQLLKSISKALGKTEEAAVVAMKSVYWLAIENMPLNKYPSLMSFFKFLKYPYIEELDVGKNPDGVKPSPTPCCRFSWHSLNAWDPGVGC